MKSRSHAPTVLAFVVGFAALPLTGYALSWPAWLCILLPTVVAGLALLRVVLSTLAPGVEEVVQEATPPDPPYLRTRFDNVPLPSGLADYDFLFSATVWWRATRADGKIPHPQPARLAGNALIARARTAVAREHPGRYGLVRYALDGELALPLADGSGTVIAFATDVNVTLAKSDQERLEQLAALRKREETWNQERQHERSRRVYIGDEILKNPGTAVAWWLARHDEEVRRYYGKPAA